MYVPTEVLLLILRHLRPEQLLVLYQIDNRLQSIVRSLFLQCKELPSCRLSETATKDQKLMNAAWRYLCPRSLRSIHNVGFKSQIVLFRTTAIGLSNNKYFECMLPADAQVFTQKAQYTTCNATTKLLYDSGTDSLIDGQM